MMEIDDVDDWGSLPLYPLLDSNIPPCNMNSSKLNSSHVDLRHTSYYYAVNCTQNSSFNNLQ